MRHLSKTIGLLATLAMLIGASAAIAHPKLESSTPAPDSPTSTVPKEIKLNFNEGVLAKFSGIELKDEAGKPVATGEPATDPKDQKQLIVPISGSLIPGQYTVSWHAVSDDTHRVDGRYSFQLVQDSAAGASEKPRGTEYRRDSELKSADKDGRGDMCKCPSSEGKSIGRESDRDDRMDGSRNRRDEREIERDGGYRSRDRDSRYRDSSRSRPECVIDDEGVKYCRVR
jgi:methionine-rich copper-binding protein CopC